MLLIDPKSKKKKIRCSGHHLDARGPAVTNFGAYFSAGSQRDQIVLWHGRVLGVRLSARRPTRRAAKADAAIAVGANPARALRSSRWVGFAKASLYPLDLPTTYGNERYRVL